MSPDGVRAAGIPGTEKQILALCLSLVIPMASQGTRRTLLPRPDPPGPVISGPCSALPPIPGHFQTHWPGREAWWGLGTSAVTALSPEGRPRAQLPRAPPTTCGRKCWVNWEGTGRGRGLGQEPGARSPSPAEGAFTHYTHWQAPVCTHPPVHGSPSSPDSPLAPKVPLPKSCFLGQAAVR